MRADSPLDNDETLFREEELGKLPCLNFLRLCHLLFVHTLILT